MAISGKFVTLPRTALVSIALLLGFAAIPCVSHAQDPASGILPFSTQSGGTYDTVDLATGNIVIKIPLRDKAGKIPFSYSLVSNSHAYKNRNTPPGTVISSGFSGQLSTGFTVRYTKTSENDGCTYLVSHYTALSAIDSTGASHPAPIDFYDRTASDGCLNPVVFPVAFKTSDGSGLTIVATGSSGGPPSAVTWVIYDKSGNVYNSNAVIQDPDGATITKTVNLGVTTYMDSLGTTALAVIPSNGSTPDQYQYAEQNGQPQTLFEVNYSTYTQQTVFGCVADIPPTSVSLPSSINTPYGTFTISYEPTPGNPTHVTGRIAQLTYPSGGFVAYAYHGGVNDVGLACSYTVPTLTRTTYDNVTSTFTSWSYQNNYTSGNYNVIETDPADNQTVHRFAGDLETERVSFQGGCTFGYSGCLGSGTIRRDVTTCYNGNTSSITACQGLAAAPSGQIVQTDVYTKLDSSPLSLVETKYDSYGNATSVSRYDYGATFPPSGTIASQVSTSFDASGSCGALSIPYMQDRPCSIVTYGSGVKTGETDFQYDAAGHVLSAAKEVDATHFPAVTKTYNANGTLNTETDVNGALYTYAYGGAGGCNNLLPTSVKTTGSGLPSNGLLQTTVWDCNGAVPTQITDANGQSKGMGYADALWRLTSSQDELGNTTNYSYFTNGSESVLNFGTNSTSDVLTTSDGLQRPIFSQRRQAQGSSSFDTVQTSYSWTYRIGLMTTVSNAYSGGAAQAAPSGTPVTTTQYDVLGRPTTVTDGAGGTTTYTYSGQDVLVSIGPAPAGENPKRRQLEYDGLGRLTSVCELTTATGSGSCGQVQAGTGFVTRYAYDGFGDLTTVMQNAQGSPVQTRTYTYDGWSRLTSEKNPEWAGGTTSYTYDSDSTGACSGTYEGDLVKKTDVAGNVSCLKYDALHRQTSVSYPSGPSA